jgi:hypothetical protein
MAPFHVIDEFGTKPLPTTVSTAPPLLVVTVAGETPVIWGTGLSIVNVAEGDVPPPGAKFITVICAISPRARSAAFNATCNCVELTNVVGRLLWFHCAVEVATKPMPVMPSEIPVVPARMLLCESEAIVGSGLSIIKPAAPELPPPGLGFTTEIWAVPEAAKSAAVTVTCNWVELTNVVGRLLWFHSTVDPCTNPLPVIVTVVDEAPTVALEGDIELIDGIGLFWVLGACSVVEGAGPPPPLQPERAITKAREKVGNESLCRPAQTRRVGNTRRLLQAASRGQLKPSNTWGQNRAVLISQYGKACR